MRKNRVTRTVGLAFGLVLVVALAAQRAWAAPPRVEIPTRAGVCMMQDTVMAGPAIALTHDGKTYYGCCEMCKAKIAADPKRYTLSRDPISGTVVDKATAELLSVDGRVLYFESSDTRHRYMEKLPRGRRQGG